MLRLEERETEIEALIRAGLLRAEKRSDDNAVIDGLYAFFDSNLT